MKTIHPTRIFLVIVSSLLVSISAKAEGLLQEKVLPLSLATEAAEAALAACEKKGYRVSVAVTDGAGLVRVLIRGDRAGAHTLDSSSRKAYTSTSLGHATGEMAKWVSDNPLIEELRAMNEKILLLGGGLPIKAGGEVIGGIGVGGAPGADKDEACAQAGLDRIKDRLK